MVIYDKNQFTFNIIFVFILICLLGLNVYYAQNFKIMNNQYQRIEEKVTEIESNQVFNFIQGAHYDLVYQLTPTGLFVNANDYGMFNGPSMQPAIFDSNTLIEQTFNNSQLEEGQIIRFMRDNGTAVIHRVRADYGDTVYVQGDSLKEGEIIRKDQITHIIIGILFT